MPGGRPSKYSDELAEEICTRLANGETLISICKDDHMPDKRNVYVWRNNNEEFRHQYTRAREDQADTFAEEIIEISDQAERDLEQTPDGPRVNIDHIQRAKLRIDARKWHASKTAPKKYGDKLDLTSNDKSMSPKPSLDLSKLSTEALIELRNAQNADPDNNGD